MQTNRQLLSDYATNLKRKVENQNAMRDFELRAGELRQKSKQAETELKLHEAKLSSFGEADRDARDEILADYQERFQKKVSKW